MPGPRPRRNSALDESGGILNVQLCTTNRIIVLALALHVLSACTTPHRSDMDVSTPSNQEFVEFDALVTVPLEVAYQNILSSTYTCWHSPFSGQILAYPGSAAQNAREISFAVPGKFLGSKVELASVRLYPASQNQTHIVGSSFAYPGTWYLTELATWANATSVSCSDVANPL